MERAEKAEAALQKLFAEYQSKSQSLAQVEANIVTLASGKDGLQEKAAMISDLESKLLDAENLNRELSSRLEGLSDQFAVLKRAAPLPQQERLALEAKVRQLEARGRK